MERITWNVNKHRMHRKQRSKVGFESFRLRNAFLSTYFAELFFSFGFIQWLKSKKLPSFRTG